ncbi:MAG TPA: hypothetical protein VJX73_08505 [Terracidiphilus sp.]|nr:hypothetical protein [Terracidiphilus sp.]
MMDFALYIDDSGHPDNQPNVVTAGFVASEDQWSQFEVEWNSALLRFGIVGAFHMTEFMREKRTGLKRDWILESLCRIINKHVGGRFLHAVDMEAYKRINDEWTLEESIGAPIALAARSLTTEINEWRQAHMLPGDDFKIFIEQGSKHYGDIEQVFKRDGQPPPTRVAKANPRCQPADMLGWEGLRYLKTGITSKNMRRLLPKGVETFGGIFLAKDLIELCKQTAVPLRVDFKPIDSISFHSEKKRKRQRTVF